MRTEGEWVVRHRGHTHGRRGDLVFVTHTISNCSTYNFVCMNIKGALFVGNTDEVPEDEFAATVEKLFMLNGWV